MEFSGRTAIVTGASQGIGEVIAREIAERGALVILVDIQEEKLHEVARKIRDSKGNAVPHRADVSSFEQANGVVGAVIKEYGKVDFLVNNAGITRDTLLMRMGEDEWDAVMNVNLKGVFNFTQSVIRNMVASRFGRIVNISSVVAEMGNPGQSNYAASKAGVIGFTKSVAREVAGRGITVNVVAPGFIETQMTQVLPAAVKKTFFDLIPMKRFGQPAEVARTVCFFLSEDASYITGQVIHVNGGLYM